LTKNGKIRIKTEKRPIRFLSAANAVMGGQAKPVWFWFVQAVNSILVNNVIIFAPIASNTFFF
jgi:hypothetical protein